MTALSKMALTDFLHQAAATQPEDLPKLDESFDQLLHLLAPEQATALIEAHQALCRVHDSANRAERTDFVVFVGHEVKNPLTSIRMSADLLAQEMIGPINATQREFINTIQRNTNRIANLTTDLSDIARLEKGSLRLDSVYFPVRLALDEALESVKAGFESKAQQVQVSVAPDLPAVQGDHVRLVQVLEHLLRNAQMYTPERGQVQVRAVAKPKTIQITISDNGIGIPPHEQPRVFKKFFRADQREVYAQSGAGLGLCLAHSLITQMGGQLYFRSVLEQGSTFTVELPQAASLSNPTGPLL
jgi:signal transduction histidine kinase